MTDRAETEKLREGDLVFIQIPYYPFMRISEATLSWTNHVGVLVRDKRGRLMVAESRVPVVALTPFERFTRRSKKGRYIIRRYDECLSDVQLAGIRRAVDRRRGRLYHTGFQLDSNRQFCSKFVREVYCEGAGIDIGEITDFRTLLDGNPDARLGFWKLWFFGRIPWNRKTVTPASLLEADNFFTAAER